MQSPVLVTGAAGFAGSHLLNVLATSGLDTVVAWHRPGGHRPPSPGPRVAWDPIDVLDRDAVHRAVESRRPRAVYHCAGAAHVGRSWDSTESTLATNVRGTHYLLKALRDVGCETRVLIPSSAMIYRPSREALTEEHPLEPTSPYGFSKLAQELLARRSATGRLAVLIGRAFNHIGPGQAPSFAASGFARRIAEIEAGLHEPEVVVGNLEARRDTIDVRDAVQAYRIILEQGRPGRPYNIASGRAVAIGELLDMLRNRARVPVRIRVDEHLFRPNDVPIVVGDATRLREELGWTPSIPITQTIDDLLAYWRASVGAPAGSSDRKR
jgi:GDP-4-dehydro-6-deoxy-D-mannose reductase